MPEQTFARNKSSRTPASAAETPNASFPGTSPEAIESPVNPKSTAGYRLALGAVILLGMLIAAGIGVLVVGLIQGWGHKGTPAAHASKPVVMTLAPGYRILSSDTQPGRLILHVRSEATDEIDIFDTEDGHVVAQIQAEAPK